MAEDKVTVSEEPAQFEDWELLPAVLSAVKRQGYATPSPIQVQMIPHMLAGRDVLGQAQTGTGKTAAFALPILSRIDLAQRTPQVIVLTPTRELAIQVAKSFKNYGADLPGFSVATIYGGQDYDIQLRQLRRGVQVVVGTPGRTIDHIKRGTLNPSTIRCVVLDEADEMLNMGFVDDVEFVLQKTSEDRQVCLFSATMPPAIRSIARRYLTNPVEIRIANRTQTVATVRQRCLTLLARDKLNALVRLLETEDTDGVLVFARTRGSTVEIAEALSHRGYQSAALNGDIAQVQRERTIEHLKAGRVNIVVATDVAARGLDVQRISHVFNYDMPPDSEAYVHRIGRTGRAGRSGEAILFATRGEQGKLRLIERKTRQPIEVMQLPTIDAVNERRIGRFKDEISSRIKGTHDLEFFKKLVTEFAQASEHPIETIAAALAHMAQGKEPLLLREVAPPARKPRAASHDGRDRPPHRQRGAVGRGGPERAFTLPEEGMERFRLSLGSNDRVGPGNIVGTITNEANIDSSGIGRIFIYDTYSTVDLRSDVSAGVLKSLQDVTLAGAKLTIARDTGHPPEVASPPARRPNHKRDHAARAPRPKRDHTPAGTSPTDTRKWKKGPQADPKSADTRSKWKKGPQADHKPAAPRKWKKGPQADASPTDTRKWKKGPQADPSPTDARKWKKGPQADPKPADARKWKKGPQADASPVWKKGPQADANPTPGAKAKGKWKGKPKSAAGGTSAPGGLFPGRQPAQKRKPGPDKPGAPPGQSQRHAKKKKKKKAKSASSGPSH